MCFNGGIQTLSTGMHIWTPLKDVFPRFIKMIQEFDVLVMHSCDHDMCNLDFAKPRWGRVRVGQIWSVIERASTVQPDTPRGSWKSTKGISGSSPMSCESMPVASESFGCPVRHRVV